MRFPTFPIGPPRLPIFSSSLQFSLRVVSLPLTPPTFFSHALPLPHAAGQDEIDAVFTVASKDPEAGQFTGRLAPSLALRQGARDAVSLAETC
jgi:hypothetical protein